MAYDSVSQAKPPRDHMSRQFTYVIHASNNPDPVHTIRDFDYPLGGVVGNEDNLHESAFHAGTPNAAKARNLNDEAMYHHVYKIDRNVLDPLMWSDNAGETPPFRYRLRDVQPMLTESVPFNRNLIDRNVNSKYPTVTPYRNMVEDRGSTSFIIPKKLVGKGVEFLGTRQVPGTNGV